MDRAPFHNWQHLVMNMRSGVDFNADLSISKSPDHFLSLIIIGCNSTELMALGLHFLRLLQSL